MKAKSLFIISLSVLIYLAGATPVLKADSVLSLKEAVETGLKNNFNISIARDNLSIADNNYSLGNSGFLPSVDIDAGQSNSINNVKQEYISGNNIDKKGAKSNTLNAGIGLTWTIFDGFRMFANHDILAEGKQQGEIGLNKSIQETVSSIILAYYDITRQKYIIDMSKEKLALSEERLKIAEDKLKVGSGSKLEVLKARSDFNDDKSSYIEEEAKLANLKIHLNELLVRDPGSIFDVDSDITLQPALKIEDLAGKIERNNPNLKQLESELKISDLQIDAQRSGYFPNINVFANYDYLYSKAESGFLLSRTDLGLSYGLNFSYNIFNGFNTSRDVQNAKIVKQINEKAYLEKKHELQSSLIREYSLYSKNYSLLDIERENFEIVQEVLGIAREQYKTGSISALEFRDIENRYIASKSKLINLKYETKVNEVTLLLLAGSVSLSY